jgi:two-component system cell cycle sensor histidine kinase/response regulator CckA
MPGRRQGHDSGRSSSKREVSPGGAIRGTRLADYGAMKPGPDSTTEEEFRSFFDHAPAGNCITAPNGRLLRVNPAFCALLGYSAEEMQSGSFMTITHPDDVGPSQECARALLAGEQETCTIDKRYLRKDGRPVWARVTTCLECDAEGRPLRFLTHVQDMDDRKQAEETLRAEEARSRQMAHELREAQDRLEHVVTSSPAVLHSLSVHGRALGPNWVSKNIERLLGFTVEEALDPGWWDGHVHPEDLPRVLAEKEALFANGYLVEEYRFADKERDYRWIRAELRLLRDPAGEAVEVIGSWTDVTAQKEAELRAKENEEQYRLLFDSNPHPMYVCDSATLAFVAVNDAAVRHYGYSREEFLAMSARDLRLSEDVPHFLRAIEGPIGRTHADIVGVFRHRKKDGTLIQMEVTRRPIRFLGRACWLVFLMDITDKLGLEAQYLQSQKMESMGRLAGGVAHDFNNLLGVITGYGDLLRRRVDGDHRLRRYVDEIGKAAERAAGLTRQLLAFSRKQVLQPRILDLNAAVGETEKMLRRLIGEDVQLVTVLDDHLGQVKADPGQIDQVLMNLAVNARDAMPRGGRLTIETDNVDLDAAGARAQPGTKPGRYVMLSVADTGHGMTAEVRARVFEPFFTTKEVGKGTGLGLATVHGIVTQSDGSIALETEPGRGTTFRIYLPRVDAPAEDTDEPDEVVAPRGSETVLLVEDEASLREIVRESLESSGYVVLSARDGEEAVDMCADRDLTIHLVLTDVVMPRMSGRELADRLRATRPDTAILYMSGYTDDAVVRHGVLAADMAFVHKPFTIEALARRVRAVLDRRIGQAA